ncbi:hypothetical protein CRG98_012057 [Punica granatum]|uniref:Uncharacterized protein n=1 Tax=Punica granatum TaxID=22663 RepID=A0A2I0KGZ1_PUNGR|nr:hypothetical protein CRG98_012057 [Punica granatum]
MLASYKVSDLPSLGIRGKSWGSVRESGDSVERLKECSVARACTFGELGARGVRLECTGGAWEASGARAGARAHGCACGQARGARGTCASALASARLALFTRE